MDISAETTTTWWENDGDRTHAKVELDIDLSIIDLEPAALTNRIVVFFETIALPEAIQRADPGDREDEYTRHLRTESKTSITGQWRCETEAYHERLTAVVEMTSSAAAHPLLAFDHARKAISHAIADHVETCVWLARSQP